MNVQQKVCPTCAGTGYSDGFTELLEVDGVPLTKIQGRILKAITDKPKVNNRHYASYEEILNWMYCDKDMPENARAVLTVEMSHLRRKLPHYNFRTVTRMGIALYDHH